MVSAMTDRTVAGRKVGAVGLGCMGMTWAYGSGDSDRAAHVRVLHRALEIGVTLIDTADAYGPYTNEELVGEALVGRRDQAFLATKCGLVHRSTQQGTGNFDIGFNGRPEHIRASIDGSLRRLRVDNVDLYQLHRVDPEVPIEESWGAMAEAVSAGKAKAIGLSEASVANIERARKVAPVASVQSELSLWTRDHTDVLEYCTREGIAFLAFSPLGRGFLTGRFTKPEDFDSNDWRLKNPRFQEGAMRANRALLDVVESVAKRQSITLAQVALAWTLAQSPVVVPIPGTRKVERLEENAAAADVVLSSDDLAELARIQAPIGGRY